MDEQSERAIKLAIIKAVEHICGAIPVRINAGKARARGGYVQGARNGTPDLAFVLHGGRMLWVEVKRATGKPSPDQLAMHEELRKRGHSVIVARDVETVVQAARAM